MKKIILGIASILLAGCIGPHGPLRTLPPVSAEENAADVYIVRNGNIIGSGMNYSVTLDSMLIFGISINEYTKFKVEQGDHRIGVICRGGWTPGTHSDAKYATMEAGKVYYFMARLGGACAVIEPLSREDGEKFVSKAKYIPIQQQ